MTCLSFLPGTKLIAQASRWAGPAGGEHQPRARVVGPRGGPLEEHAMTSPYDNEQPMPAESTRNLFLWVSGFGIGAMLVLFGFVFLIGIGQLGHSTASGPSAATPA